MGGGTEGKLIHPPPLHCFKIGDPAATGKARNVQSAPGAPGGLSCVCSTQQASECMARRVRRAHLCKQVLQGLPGCFFFSVTNYESIKLSSCCLVSPGAVSWTDQGCLYLPPSLATTAEAGPCSEQRIHSKGCSHSPSPIALCHPKLSRFLPEGCTEDEQPPCANLHVARDLSGF